MVFKGEEEFYAMLRAGHLDTKSGFLECDAKALGEVVKTICRKGMMIVEVGSWKGFSTAVLAKTVADYDGKVFAVDHWMGSKGTWHDEVVRTQDIYAVFKHNMVALGVWDTVYPLVMDSQTACLIFADNILDLVFIDANHCYEYIKADIASWMPKLKEGGILCGHDCEGFYSKFSKEKQRHIDEHLNEDFVDGHHCGVIKALYEYFGDSYKITTGIWYHIKGKSD